MEAREIYAALFDTRGPVKEPTGDWHHVGDLQNFDEERFRALIEREITSSHALVAVSRSLATKVETRLLGSVVREYLKTGEVRIADMELRRFVQINPIGVARTWGA